MEPNATGPSSHQTTGLELNATDLSLHQTTGLEPNATDPSSHQTAALEPNTTDPSSHQTTGLEPNATDPPSPQTTGLEPSAKDTLSQQTIGLEPYATDPSSHQTTGIEPNATDFSSQQTTGLVPNVTDPSSHQTTGLELNAKEPPLHHTTGSEPNAADPSSHETTGLEPNAKDPSSHQTTRLKPNATDASSHQTTGLEPEATDPSSHQATGLEPNTKDTSSHQSTGLEPNATDSSLYQATGLEPNAADPSSHQTTALEPNTTDHSSHQTTGLEPNATDPPLHQTTGLEPNATDPSSHQTTGLEPSAEDNSSHQTTVLEPNVTNPSSHQTTRLEPNATDPSSHQTTGIEPNATDLSLQPITALEPNATDPSSHQTTGLKLNAKEPSLHHTTGSEPNATDSSSHETTGLEPNATDPSSHRTTGVEPNATDTSSHQTTGLEPEATDTSSHQATGLEANAKVPSSHQTTGLEQNSTDTENCISFSIDDWGLHKEQAANGHISLPQQDQHNGIERHSTYSSKLVMDVSNKINYTSVRTTPCKDMVTETPLISYPKDAADMDGMHHRKPTKCGMVSHGVFTRNTVLRESHPQLHPSEITDSNLSPRVKDKSDAMRAKICEITQTCDRNVHENAETRMDVHHSSHISYDHSQATDVVSVMSSLGAGNALYLYEFDQSCPENCQTSAADQINVHQPINQVHTLNCIKPNSHERNTHGVVPQVTLLSRDGEYGTHNGESSFLHTGFASTSDDQAETPSSLICSSMRTKLFPQLMEADIQLSSCPKSQVKTEEMLSTRSQQHGVVECALQKSVGHEESYIQLRPSEWISGKPSSKFKDHKESSLKPHLATLTARSTNEHSNATLKNQPEEISTVLATNGVQVLNNSATNTYNVYLAHLPVPQEIDITQAPGSTKHDANASGHVAEAAMDGKCHITRDTSLSTGETVQFGHVDVISTDASSQDSSHTATLGNQNKKQRLDTPLSETTSSTNTLSSKPGNANTHTCTDRRARHSLDGQAEQLDKSLNEWLSRHLAAIGFISVNSGEMEDIGEGKPSDSSDVLLLNGETSSSEMSADHETGRHISDCHAIKTVVTAHQPGLMSPKPQETRVLTQMNGPATPKQNQCTDSSIQTPKQPMFNDNRNTKENQAWIAIDSPYQEVMFRVNKQIVSHLIDDLPNNMDAIFQVGNVVESISPRSPAGKNDANKTTGTQGIQIAQSNVPQMHKSSPVAQSSSTPKSSASTDCSRSETHKNDLPEWVLKASTSDEILEKTDANADNTVDGSLLLCDRTSSTSELPGKSISSNSESCHGNPDCYIEPKQPAKQGKKNCYDKKDYCLFCGVSSGNICRHIEDVHRLNPRVSDILMLPRGEQRRVATRIVINEGNFKHNVEVMKQGKGHFVIARRASHGEKEHSPWEYLPCEFCKLFVLQKLLWHHIEKCQVRQYHQITVSNESSCDDDEVNDHSIGGKAYTRKGKQLLYSALTESVEEEALKKLFMRMHDDEIKDIAMRDVLIRRVGYLRMEGLGDETVQKQTDPYRISQSMRSLARLVKRARQDKPAVSLWSLLGKDSFDVVIKSAKAVSFEEEQAFTLAGKLANLISYAVMNKIGLCLRTDDHSSLQDANAFKALFDLEFNDRVTKVANKKKAARDMSKREELPLARDLVSLRDYIVDNCKNLTTELLTVPSPGAWQYLCRFLHARIILFNKRRGNEVSELKLETYQDRPNWTESSMEFDEGMSFVEKEFSKR